VQHHNNHSFDELSATFVVIKGRPMHADLSFVQMASGYVLTPLLPASLTLHFIKEDVSPKGRVTIGVSSSSS
jgi:hypothetical protein